MITATRRRPPFLAAYTTMEEPLSAPNARYSPAMNPSTAAAANAETTDSEIEDSTTSRRPSTTRTTSQPSLSEVLATAAFCGLSFLVHLANPHSRPIPAQYLESSQEYVLSLALDEQFDGDTISDALLVFLAAVLPFVGQIALGHYVLKQRNLFRVTACTYFVAFGLNSLASESIKLYVGYLRPSFYQLCQPDEEYQECTGDEADDSRKSFPSGHASQSFCGLVLLTLFLHHKFGVPSATRSSSAENSAGDGAIRVVVVRPSHRLASVLALLPVALAIFVGTSRLHDNKHFPADVVGGAVLGGSIAVYTFGIYFFELR